MSWQPNWPNDTHGGFRRGRAGSEEGEEVEESGEVKPPQKAKREDGEMEEEGEIPPVPIAAAAARSVSTGQVDLSGQFRGGRGTSNARFVAGRDRPIRQRNSFSGIPSPRIPPPGVGFSAGGSVTGPPFQRDGHPPPPPPPPGFRGVERDVMDGQPPRGPARDFREFAGPSNASGSRVEKGSVFGVNRDFRNDPPPPNRDFSDGPQSRPPPRDFRPSGPPLGRDFRNDRDYRDRSDGPPPQNREFRPPIQPTFTRDRGTSLSLHRDPSFGPGPRDSGFRDTQASFRDGPNRDEQFPDGASRDFRDGGPRDPPFRGSILSDREGFGSREVSGGRDQNANRGTGMSFPLRGPLNRETSHGGYTRDALFDDGHEDQKPLQRASSTGVIQAVNTGLPPPFSPGAPKTAIIQGVVPPHKVRPTDPRRRASAGSTPGPFGSKPDIPSTDPRISNALPNSTAGVQPFDTVPASHPPRRMSSYSSLADGSSIPLSQAPMVPHQSNEGIMVGPNDRTGVGLRSPIPPRRTFVDSTSQNDSGNYFPSSQRHTSLGSDHGRTTSGGPQNPNRGMHHQQPPPSPTRLPQLVSTRPSNVRVNDPRFRQQERSQAEELGRSDTSMPNSHNIGKTAMETFGRSRDWKDNQIGGRTGISTPRSSPVKQKSIRSFSSSPQGEKTLANGPSLPKVQPSTKVPLVSTSDGSAKIKSEPILPLSTDLLGDHEVVSRAKGALRHLMEVVPGQSKESAGHGDESKLPTKQVIMSAVTEIEKLIKESQRRFEDLVEKKKTALEKEEKERVEKAARLAEEALKKSLEQERLVEEEKREEEKRRESGLKKALEEHEDLVLETRNRLEREFRENLDQAKDDERQRFAKDTEDQIAKAASSFDKDIAKSKRELEKAKAAVQRAETKISAAESDYQSLLRNEDDTTKMNDVSIEPVSRLSQLVQSISAKNKRYSSEAHMFAFALVADTSSMMSETEASLRTTTDPKYCRTNKQWSDLATQVSSLDEALYSDPSEAPYFEHSEKKHSIVGLSVKEFVRDRQQRLFDEWNQLAEEFEVRRRLYEKQQKKLAKRGQQRSSLSIGRSSMVEEKKTKEKSRIERENNTVESTGRSSNNPYRRARRGNEVRSEYEQEQIIAEIAAKEAMEKRIAYGGCKLPRQICRLERQVTASYVETFTAHKIDDPIAEEQQAASSNIWTDMEKCIFLDRFLQFPKDFRRIATFLRNKTTKDCIGFYYDSKQAVPYKGALKEHMMRRKRKGDYQIWDASIQAAISVGASVTAGSSEEKPVTISLPLSDRTYYTRMLHPLKREVLDAMRIGTSLDDFDEEDLQIDEAKPKSKKRNRDPLFSLGKEHTKFLRMSSQESMAGIKVVARDEPNESKDVSRSVDSEAGPTPSSRKAPQKWTAAEKRIFVETLEEHGRDWARLSKAVGTKSISQIKNYYYDYKKQSGKYRGGPGKKTSREFGQKDKTLGGPAEGSRNPEVENDKLPVNRKAEECQSSKEAADLRNEMSPDHELEKLEIARDNAHLAPNRNDYVETSSEAGNRELLQHLLNQQLQQQQLGQQHLQINQQPHSALQQLLAQHHHQRDHHQSLGQLSLEDTYRLLQHQQSQSHQQHGVSSLLPWLTASQLLQAQSRIQQAQAAAALQQQESTPLSSVSDISDVANFQRLLQMQQANQNPFGINQANRSQLHQFLLSGTGMNSPPAPGPSAGVKSPGGSALSAGFLSQLEKNSGKPTAIASETATENLAALAGAQRLLGFGNTNQRAPGSNINLAGGRGIGLGALGTAASSLDSGGVADALSLLARGIPRADANKQGGFGGLQDGAADR